MNDEPLVTYLNDHLAGSAAGKALAEQCAASNSDDLLIIFLQKLVTTIEDEQEVLKDLIKQLDGEPNPAKAAVGWLGEKVSRLKLNNPLQTSTPLNCLEQLETLLLGVRGKRALWAALSATLATDARFSHVDFDELGLKAEQQLYELEQFRLAAARDAFFVQRSNL